MADLFDLVAKLTLDSSEYSSGLDSALGKIKNVGGTIAKVGTAAVGAAAAGIVAFGKSAVEAAANYETSFAQLQTIMDSTAVSTDKMSAGLMEMSSRMGVSASELAETTYNAISATGDTAGALSIVENATKLATAGFTDTASSLSVLTTAMNSYKMSAEETAGISDSLIAVQNLGVTTVAELSSSMGKAIASASAYSVDLYNLESAYVSMTKSGINTAESTTYISSMMKELGSESTTVAKLIKTKTGKSFAQLMKDGKSLGDVLGVLNEAVDGDANALMNLWGSAEAGKASNAILSQGLDQFNENLVSIQNSAGLTESAYDKMTSTLQHKTELLKTNFENLKIAVGTGMIPGVGEFIDLITNSVGGITEAVQSGDWDKAFDTIGDTIGNGLSLIVQKIPDVIGTAKTVLASLGASLGEHSDEIIDGIFEGLDALLGVGDSNTGETAKKFGEVAGKIITKIGTELGEHASDYLEAAVKIIGGFTTGLLSEDNVSGYIEAAGAIVGGIVAAIPNVTEEFVAGADEIINGLAVGIEKGALKGGTRIIEAITGLFSGSAEESEDDGGFLSRLFGSLFSEEKQEKAIKDNMEIGALAMLMAAEIGRAFQEIGSFIGNDILSPIGEAVGNAVSAISEQIGTVFSSIGEVLSGTWENIKTTASEAWTAISTAASSAWSGIKTTVELAVGAVKLKFDEFKMKIDEIKGKFEEFGAKVKTVFEDIKAAITEKINEALHWGEDLMRNLAQGIANGVGWVVEQVKKVAESIWSRLHQSTAEVGPLKDTDQWTPDLMDNLIHGFDSKRGELERKVADVAKSMDFRDAVPETMTYSVATTGTATQADSKIDAILDAIHEVADALRNQTIEMDGEKVADLIDSRLGSKAALAARV